jgi:hypothetical protein
MTFYYAYAKSVLVGENVCHERSLANYNKTRINIGHQHDRWIELKETLRVQTHAEEKY